MNEQATKSLSDLRRCEECGAIGAEGSVIGIAHADGCSQHIRRAS